MTNFKFWKTTPKTKLETLKATITDSNFKNGALYGAGGALASIAVTATVAAAVAAGNDRKDYLGEKFANLYAAYAKAKATPAPAPAENASTETK